MCASSPIAIKSKSPSSVGASNVRYSSISCFAVIAAENHSAPFEIHIGKIKSVNIWSRSSLCSFTPHDFMPDNFSNSFALNAFENSNASLRV